LTGKPNAPAGPVVGSSTNPAVQQAVKDASGGQFVAKTAPHPAAPAASYTGPTAGGAPTNLPAGINRLTGKPNAPAAATPVNECNYTMENEYCPVHGLEECYGTGVFESELARIKALLK
jgi:hypothetical protein